MSEPVHGGPVTDFVDDLYHKLGTDDAVKAAIREVMQRYVKPYFASLSPAPDFIDNLLYPFLENAVCEGVVRGHALIHKD
jgi:hypothetical protein